MAESGAIPATFNLCSASRQFSTAVLTDAQSSTPTPTTGRLEVRRLTESHGRANDPVAGHEAECYWGELTDLGRRSTLVLGQKLRQLYVDELGFLEPVLDNEQSSATHEKKKRKGAPTVTFRSTGMPRTIESLHQIAEGLFPSSITDDEGVSRPARKGPIEYVVRSPEDESLYPNSMCHKLRKLDEVAAERVAQKWNPTLEQFDAKIGKYVGAPLRVDGKPRANGILDTVAACKAHGIKVPPELDDPAMLAKLEQVIVHEWFDGYESDEFKKLAMGRLLGDLRHQLERAMSDREDAPKLSVYACHDTSVGGIVRALDAFDFRWPPFTSHVAVELLKLDSVTAAEKEKDKDKPKQGGLLSRALGRSSSSSTATEDYYVRVRFNAENMKLPACAAPGKHLEGTSGTVCTWSAFREAVSKVEMTAQEWEKGCKVGPGEMAKLASKIG